RYDQAINFWGQPTDPVTSTWGSRNKVMVAINGFFYGPPFEPSGVPWSGQIHSGWYAKRFYDNETGSAGSGFAWKTDRSVFIGGCVSHPAGKQFIDFEIGGTQIITGVNRIRAENELILYTPQYDRDTNTEGGEDSLEVLVEMERPTFVALASDMSFGYVREIRDQQGSTLIPFDHIVLSAHGKARDKLIQSVRVGHKIGIAQKIKHGEQDNCLIPNADDWVGTYASVAGSYYFLMDGVIRNFDNYSDATSRNPRTAVAYNENYIFFIVVDGRNPLGSLGMNIHELAVFTKETLLATHAIAQDGGGSSTMWVNGAVKNNVFCNNGNCPFNLYLPIVNKTGEGSNNSPSIPAATIPTNASPTATELTPNIINNLKNGQTLFESDQATDLQSITGSFERAVANGLMMVVVEPITKTTTFTPTDHVVTLYNSNVRLGPGTNYAVIDTVPEGTPGVVLDHMNGLNGVLAKNYNWWKVEFPDGIIGWIAESLLALDEGE
ncbi:MAG: phosphodiester glycosidase family protein, partial [Anaerolineales bacterium]